MTDVCYVTLTGWCPHASWQDVWKEAFAPNPMHRIKLL